MSQKYHGWRGEGGLERPLRGFTWARDVTFQFVIFPPRKIFLRQANAVSLSLCPLVFASRSTPRSREKKKWTKSVRIVVTPTELLMNHFLNSPFPAETRSETGWLPVSCVADVRRGDNMAARSSMRTSSWKTVFAYDRSILPPPCPRSSFVHVFSPLPPPPLSLFFPFHACLRIYALVVERDWLNSISSLLTTCPGVVLRVAK